MYMLLPQEEGRERSPIGHLVFQPGPVCQQERVAFFGMGQELHLLSTFSSLSLPRDLLPIQACPRLVCFLPGPGQLQV